MNALKEEIDRFAQNRSEDEIRLAIGELLKMVVGKRDPSRAIPIQDTDERPVGYFVADETIRRPDMSDYATFMAVTRYRIANPPDRYLTPEEFIAVLERPG